MRDVPYLRGGCWSNELHVQLISTFTAVGISPEYREPYGGFRCFRNSREPLRKP